MQGMDINNSSVQQHAVNMTFPLKSSTGDATDGLEVWVPDGHLYIIDNLLIVNQHSGDVTATIYLWQHGQASNSYSTGANNFIGDDETTPQGKAAENIGIWRKTMATATTERPFGDTPFYLMAGQAFNIYVTTNGVASASYSFRDCF